MFYVFAGSKYYPYGGAHDCAGVFASLAEAIAYAKGRVDSGGSDWAHVATVQEEGRLQIVFES